MSGPSSFRCRTLRTAGRGAKNIRLARRHPMAGATVSKKMPVRGGIFQSLCLFLR